MFKSFAITGLTLAVAAGASANFVTNGSFELGTYSGGAFETLGVGNTSLTGWAVTANTVDWVDSSYWQASSGSKSIDLTGTPGAGTLKQSVALTAGSIYKLTFDYSGNPDIRQRDALNVTVGNLNSFAFYNTVTEGNTHANMKYHHFSALFKAGPSNVLTFKSLNPGLVGPVIDNVSIVATPEPMTIGIFAIGAAGLLARRKKLKAHFSFF